jgi:ribosomal protein S14
MKRRTKDRGVRERVDRRWGVRTRRKGSKSDRRRVEAKYAGYRRERNRNEERIGTHTSSGRSKRREGEQKRVLEHARQREMGEEKKRWRERSKRLGGREGEGSKVRNRCVETGHGRSVIRWFRKSGRKVRERVRSGKCEGVYRVSW